MLLQFIKGLLPPAAKSHVKANCSPFHFKLKCRAAKLLDVWEVHLCDLGEVDYWALVNSLSLNFQSLCGDIHTRLVITTAMRFWKMQKPNIVWDKAQDIYEKLYRNLVLVTLPWWALWSYSHRLGKSQRQIVQAHGVFLVCTHYNLLLLYQTAH